MTARPSEPAPPTVLSREAADALAAELAREMSRRWRQGERPLPEEFLDRHPHLWKHPEAAADLIYEELCLRQDHGPEVPVEQVLQRFPRWRPQIEVLFDCQRLLEPRRTVPLFPRAGESLGDFLLLAELGRGAQGRVFLASQLSLGDRPVVLKLTPGEANEHLSLARLQHTHIVPLYSVQDHPGRGLAALCMPYFGGATLAQLLDTVQSQPPARRTGQALLDALDRIQAAAPLIAPARRQVRPSLATASYAHAVCWIGACLADALHYAHERGLVHLDLKPSNVLIAADGQPMVLDFHVARGPIDPTAEGSPWLGGTHGYMSPEQEAALRALRRGRPVPLPVDGRSDIYSLGLVLYEALGGIRPEPVAPSPLRTTVRIGAEPPVNERSARGGQLPLSRCNPQVSVGLADIIGKCLADDPDDRYPHMAALAADLRRHLADLPLAGVRNRSLAERWRKWRRRRPHGAALAGMMLAVLTAAGAVALGGAGHVFERIEQARTALNDGQARMAGGQWDGAITALQRGLSAVQGIPLQDDLTDELARRLRLAEQGRVEAQRAAAVRDLQRLADRARFLYGADDHPPEALRSVAEGCRTLWEKRGRIVERLGTAFEPAVRDDMLDLAIVWADLQVRLAAEDGKPAARWAALAVLADAESLFGPSPVLDEERKWYGATADHANRPAATAWEHYALGRALLRSGDLDRAAAAVKKAVALRPQDLWPNFYQGQCAFRRGRYADAALAYSVCIGAAPESAGCFYNRAVALAALGQTEQARRDFDHALRLDPTLAPAALNRGMVQQGIK